MFQTKVVTNAADPVARCRDRTPKNTNTRYKNFKQTIYTAGDVEQFNSSRRYDSLRTKTPDLSTNVFKNSSQKIWFKNVDIDSEDVENTFKYLFYKFKKGLFVKISNNDLSTFLPFTNAHYRNEFENKIVVDPKKFHTVQDFLNDTSRKSGIHKPQQHIPLNEWVPNNALMRYEYRYSEGDNNVVILNHMLKTLCSERNLPDVEFFINRRDFPQMKINSTEPYNHIYDSSNFPLLTHNYKKYSPVLSSSSTTGFADILMPTFEDWARAQYQETGEIFPNACREYPVITSSWSDKINKAVFRGATTGAGFNSKTNQRLKAYDVAVTRPDLFDFGFTKWNLRPRKYEGEKYLQTIERPSYPVSNHLTLQEQSQYKYILNLEGHVAAYRLSYELSSGSVVLLASSKWKMWYSELLKPYVHYVPVSEDLSDLIAQLEWCKNNDYQCENIVKNAQSFYDLYLGTKGILDFLQKELWDVSQQTGSYEYFPDLLPWSIQDEKKQLFNQIVFSDKIYKHPIFPGPRCIGRLDGISEVMRSKSFRDLKVVRLNNLEHLMENVNGTITLFETNKTWVVGKKANNDAKILEHVHESFIGLNAINNLVGKIPNFAYIFGPLKDAQDMIFSEYISGISFHKWLESHDFNIRDYLMILVQINLALSVAQNFTGFVHHDLYPWNVIIQKIPVKVKFTYFIDVTTIITIETDIIPVIIDYGKSRAIVYEKEFGLIDHGFANLYRSNKIVDSLTILYSSLNIINHRFRSSGPFTQVEGLIQFAKKIGLPYASDIKFNNYFGSLFESVKNIKKVRPIDFINFVVIGHPEIFNDILSKPETYPGEFYVTEKGNPVQTSLQMFYGDENEALLGVIDHINKSRPPLSSDSFFQQIISNILRRRLIWIDDEIFGKGSTIVKRKWETLRKIFEYQPTPITHDPLIDYPKPQKMYTSGFMSPRYVKLQQVNPESDDWKKVWTMFVEAYLFRVIQNIGEIGEFIQIDGFEYMNAISSHNLLNKMKKLL